MFTRLIQIFGSPRTSDYDREFIREVKIQRPLTRSPKSGFFLCGAWALIGLKCWAVIWAIERYHIPVHPLWITLPTLLFGGICTALYFKGE